MHTDEALLVFNNFVAGRRIAYWELHVSAPGHDQDELFLQFTDGQVLRIMAEHRTDGAALRLEPHSRLPIGRAVRNLPQEYNNRALGI
jgi:hypothetical protein